VDSGVMRTEHSVIQNIKAQEEVSG